jgi:hypothetical protein
MRFRIERLVWSARGSPETDLASVTDHHSTGAQRASAGPQPDPAAGRDSAQDWVFLPLRRLSSLWRAMQSPARSTRTQFGIALSRPLRRLDQFSAGRPRCGRDGRATVVC